MKNGKILLVDDEKSYLILMEEFLRSEGYSSILTESSPKKALEILRNEEIDLVLCDVRMEEMSGLEILEQINVDNPDIPFIMVTAVDHIDVALQSTKLGAYDYITKPPDTERLLLTINRALQKRILEKEIQAYRSSGEALSRKPQFEDVITTSPLMHKVFELVEIYAPTNETVLIIGETGTGKDLISRKIHELSPRKEKPFIAVNIASLSSTLFESELFGHKKGAFTGAESDKTGYFEAADGGTIFLDEIGELPKELQGKLLRVIQYGEVQRIGDTKPIKLDIRIIAATNKNLSEAVEQNEFRADLYYRLNRGFIKLPPLRERGDDIILLAEYFLTIANKTYKKEIKGFSEKAKSQLKRYDFSGNIRELENIVMNVVARSVANGFISDMRLKNSGSAKNAAEIIKDFYSLDEAMGQYIQYILDQTGNDIQRSAEILGISPRTLYRKIQKNKMSKAS